MPASEFASLPRLRDDIRIFSSGVARSGAEQFVLFDPVRGKYQRLGWREAMLLRFWQPGLTLDEFCQRVRAATTLRPTVNEVMAFCRLLAEMALLAGEEGQRGKALPAARDPGSLPWWQRFFGWRIPLVYPDMWLEVLMPVWRIILSPFFLIAAVAVGIVGLFLAIGRVEQYLHTFMRFWGWQGALAYGAAIIGVKILHELAHAIAAKACGVPVRSAGVLFIFFWLVPYTDITDAWRLADRYKRLAIAAAGVAAEILLAGVCLFGWAISEPGLAQSVCFVLSSATLASSLLVNLNPLLRFDGYYLLSDLLAIDNLFSRGQVFGRWFFRRWILGWQTDYPEPLPAPYAAMFACYGVFSYLYRMTIYASLAALAAYMIAKPVGIAILIWQIWRLVLLPLTVEIRLARRSIRTRSRLPWPVILAGLVCFWLAAPLPRTTLLPAAAAPDFSHTLQAPISGRLAFWGWQRGRDAATGELLAKIEDEEGAAHLRSLRSQYEELTAKRLTLLAQDKPQAASIRQCAEDIERKRAQIAAAEARVKSGEIAALCPALWLEGSEEINVGSYIREGEILGRLLSPTANQIVAYAMAGDLPNLREGSECWFYPADGGEPWPCGLAAVSATPVSAIEQGGLAAIHGGPIDAVLIAGGRWRPLENIFEVRARLRIAPGRTPPAPGQCGWLRLRTSPRSLLAAWLHRLRHAWQRESSWF